ncbi:MAG: hypothetical protein PHT96_07275 [Syntrophorhabdaceae bacterium]|nr:hypothetical protein [Syntrophorhabdaceae bacterium]MDD4196195.1 hypothetical protein [Syntrophorhabdaceae bacterium]HOC46900.1 hypothetical protein [Syntrophorhabdaceae bacterium]
MMRGSFIVGIVLFWIITLFTHVEAISRDVAASPYQRYIVYQALILFWIGIIGLVIIIIMKLKEVKRIQDMDVHKEDEDAPFLD